MILVTGATGFIGRSVMLRLEQQGRPAKAFQGRINDPQSIGAELADVSAVIHLAGAEARDRVHLLELVDVRGTELLLEECRRFDVKRIVMVSRLNADARSIFGLLRAKGQAERSVRRGGIPFTIVRSATLFGRDDRFLNVITALAAWTWPIILLPSGGRVAMQPLWVEDLVTCLLLALEQPDLINQTIEVAGEERLHYADIARIALETAGLQRRPLGLPVKLARPISALAFGWWRRPPVTRFWLDRFSVPEVAPVDSVYRNFEFRPMLMRSQTAYLRQRGARRHLFNLA